MGTLKSLLYRRVLGIALGCSAATACDGVLEVEPASEFSDAFLATRSGMKAVLNSAYDNIQPMSDPGALRIYIEEATTDVLLNFRGVTARGIEIMKNFTWDAANTTLEAYLWVYPYRAIRDANIVLDKIDDNGELTTQEKALYAAEARFIRATAYSLLYGYYGPVSLVTSSTDEIEKPRATEQEMIEFVEKELLAAAEVLPLTAPEYGRATRGAALGMLAKFTLNTRQWQKAADLSKRVMDLGKYSLFPDYAAMFAIANEGNAEMIFVSPGVAREPEGNVWVANALPVAYPTHVTNTPTQVTLSMPFYNSFAPEDLRKKPILTQYVNLQGQFINLLIGDEYLHPRSLKYPLDPNADGRAHGTDIPYLRYADILLTRAEALNELQGPNAESFSLINQVRRRAGLKDLTMAEAGTKAAFLDRILDERNWEFYSEAKRREDLIRHGRFISSARARGVNAQPHHVRYPIPQADMDANPALVQNPGY